MRQTRSHTVVFGVLISAFVVLVSAVGFWKFANFRYGGLDLAIYTNVLWNLVHGGGWWSSIQGGSYLGDHVEPILFLIAPLFRFWPDARLLIVLQALALGLTAVPVSLLLRNARIPHRVAMLFTALWLFNPLLWNIALFEFHAIAFAPLFLLSAAYAYLRRRPVWFACWAVFAFMVREDIALIVAMFGVVAAIDWWRHRRVHVAWVAAPLLLGLVWFLVALRIAGSHSASGGYKFSVYYGWLFNAGPTEIFRHLVSLGNIDMVLGLLLPVLFLPFFRPRWLLLSLPPLAQFVLGASGGSNLVVDLHYSALFIPGLALAAIAAIVSWRHVPAVRWRQWIMRQFPLPRPFAIGIGIAMYMAAAWFIGPFSGITGAIAYGVPVEQRERIASLRDAIARIPDGATVLASESALPQLAARHRAYDISYASLGVTQFGFAPYELPSDLASIVLDAHELAIDAAVLPTVSWAAPYADGMQPRLRSIVHDNFGVVFERAGITLLARARGEPPSFDRLLAPLTTETRGGRIVDSLRDIQFVADEDTPHNFVFSTDSVVR